jgi:hypothetical protein
MNAHPPVLLLPFWINIQRHFYLQVAPKRAGASIHSLLDPSLRLVIIALFGAARAN